LLLRRLCRADEIRDLNDLISVFPRAIQALDILLLLDEVLLRRNAARLEMQSWALRLFGNFLDFFFSDRPSAICRDEIQFDLQLRGRLLKDAFAWIRTNGEVHDITND
jgi:hypothetical protein